MPISCVGVMSTHTTHGRKSAVLYLWFDGHHFWQEDTYSFKNGICEAEGLICLWTKITVRGPHCFEVVIAWKVPKFGILHEVASFLKIYSHLMVIPTVKVDPYLNETTQLCWQQNGYIWPLPLAHLHAARQHASSSVAAGLVPQWRHLPHPWMAAERRRQTCGLPYKHEDDCAPRPFDYDLILQQDSSELHFSYWSTAT